MEDFSGVGFFGLEVKPNVKLVQVPPVTFRVTMAALGEPWEQGKRSVLKVEVDDQEFVLCNLIGGVCDQQMLDAVFPMGEKIAFSVSGPCSIFLTGYSTEDENAYDSDEDDMMMGDEDDDEEGFGGDGEDDFDDGDSDDDEDDDDEEEEDEGSDDEDIDALKADPPKPRTKAAKARLMISKKVNNGEDDDDDDDDDDEEDNFSGDNSGVDDEDDDDDDDDDDEVSDVDPAELKADKQRHQGILAGKKISEIAPGLRANYEDYSSDFDEEGNDSESDDGEMSPATEAQLRSLIADSERRTSKVQADDAISKKKKRKRDSETSEPEDAPRAKTMKSGDEPTWMTRHGGLKYRDLALGSGKKVKNGQRLHIKYVGRLSGPNGKVFDKNLKAGFPFRKGAREVIEGWEAGVEGMQVGGKRELVIPPGMGYGARGTGPIPGNATLHFTVELVKIS